MTEYKPTELERRHPNVVARKRKEAANALAESRYRDGDCTGCGYQLDDVALSEGYEKCGECEAE